MYFLYKKQALPKNDRKLSEYPPEGEVLVFTTIVNKLRSREYPPV